MCDLHVNPQGYFFLNVHVSFLYLFKMSDSETIINYTILFYMLVKSYQVLLMRLGRGYVFSPADKPRLRDVLGKNLTNENLIRNVFSSPACVSKRRRGYRKVGGGWRGQKYYDPPSANSASNTTGAVREGNLRVPSLRASRGALPEHKHALEK